MDIIEETKFTAVESQELNFLDFQTAKPEFDRLIGSWTTITAATLRNRELRYQKGVDSQDLRDSGAIKQDEMYNPVHIIDTNIRREQPQLVNYLTQSRRSILFCPKEQEPVDGIDKLEQDFTNKARYLGWEIPFIRCFDGAQTHGWDSVEVRFEENYPGNFCFYHVGHANLIFAYDSEDINVQEVLMQKEQMSAMQLRGFVQTKGWKSELVEEIISKAKNSNKGPLEDVNTFIYKVFFKKNGMVMFSWMHQQVNDYLVDPAPLFLGVRDTTVPMQPMSDGTMDYPKVPEKEFPHTIYKYIESEDPIITNLYGRTKMDEAVQEAVSAMSSALINGTVRASNVYASPHPTTIQPNPNVIPKALDVVLKNGAIFDTALDWFHLPYPDPSVIQSIQAITMQNQQEQSQIDFATVNRKDSGKTATEIQAATQKASELSSVQIILISIFIRQAYAKAWRIYQSRVLQEKIEVSPELLPLFGDFQEQPNPQQPDIGLGRRMLGFIPGMQLQQLPPVKIAIPAQYIIKSSGDVDVIQRAETLQKMMQAWPVMSNTPIANEFLKSILRASFPEDASRYIQVLDTAQQSQEVQLKTMLGQVANVLHSAVSEPGGGIKPEFQQHAMEFQQLAQQVQQLLGQGQQQKSPTK